MQIENLIPEEKLAVYAVKTFYAILWLDLIIVLVPCAIPFILNFYNKKSYLSTAL